MILKKNVFVTFVIVLLSFCSWEQTFAQKIGLRSSVAPWAVLAPNLGVDLTLNSNFSFNIQATYRPNWRTDECKEFLIVQPELRYWIGRPHARHFVGVSAFYLDNDLLYKENFYKGSGIAAGLTYGYSYVLSKHWNIEASVGVGALYSRQSKTKEKIETTPHINDCSWKVVPMKCAIAFVYFFK